METLASLVAVHEPIKIIRKKKFSGQQKREELEREVSVLRKMLNHEQKVYEILESMNHRHEYRPALSILNFLPPKAKELLAELAMVDDEIARLEVQISQLQSDLNREKEITKEYKSRKLSLNDDPPPPLPGGLSSPHSYLGVGGGGERSVPVAFETKALHFISKAINGDYSVNNFSLSEKSRNSGALSVDHRLGNSFRDVGGFHDKSCRKSGMMLKPSSPMREPTHPTPGRESNVETSLDFPSKPATSTSIQPEEEAVQKWPPNKLAESIMKCLIFVFVRLLRTSRAMEMERSGPISRSGSFCLSSRSFRVDAAVISTTSKPSLLQKESKQQDPYGIFNAEESIPRDIGPYKNLVVFTARNFDPKCISNSSSISLLQRLRVLMNSLQKVDLRFLTYQQKLAFWINIYNACIMHGFLQYGVPSSSEKLLTLMNKATMNVGGNTINAHAIEHFILRKPTSSVLKEKGAKEHKEANVRKVYGLESLDPNVTFSLCCGTRSSPAVRIYTADGVTAELEKSKLEYLQASIMVTSTKRIALPELLLRHMRDFAQDTDSLVEWVCHQLPNSGSLRKSMVDCFRSLNGSSAKFSTIVEKIPYDFEFQYLLPI